MLLEECKCIVNKNKTSKFITDDIEIYLNDSDKQDSSEENSDEENPDEEN